MTNRKAKPIASPSADERRTAAVVVLAAVTMVLEIVAGRMSHSVALTAAGIHMGAHVVILGMSWGAYVLVRRRGGRGRERLLPATAAASATILLLLAVGIGAEAGDQLWSLATHPAATAPEMTTLYVRLSTLIVAVIGLAVNVASALILHGGHDLNRRAAYLHVLADALTSLATIVSLCCAWLWGILWLDPVVAFASAIVIAVWAAKLLRKCLLSFS